MSRDVLTTLAYTCVILFDQRWKMRERGFIMAHSKFAPDIEKI